MKNGYTQSCKILIVTKSHLQTKTKIVFWLTWVAEVSVWIFSRAITENTHVFPVPDLACTIKSAK